MPSRCLMVTWRCRHGAAVTCRCCRQGANCRAWRCCRQGASGRVWRLCYRGLSEHDAAAAYRGAAVVVAAGAGLSAHASLSVRRSRAWRPARTPRRVRVPRRARTMPRMQLISAALGAASAGAASVERAVMRCACGAAAGGASILGVVWPEARRGPRGACTGLAVLSLVSVGGAAGTREPVGAADPRLAALVSFDALTLPQPPGLSAACTSA